MSLSVLAKALYYKKVVPDSIVKYFKFRAINFVTLCQNILVWFQKAVVFFDFLNDQLIL